MYPGRRFDGYAILGDDIVISDSKVAAVYEQSLPRLEVNLSVWKSFISETGCAEFAKRFFVRNI